MKDNLRMSRSLSVISIGSNRESSEDNDPERSLTSSFFFTLIVFDTDQERGVLDYRIIASLSDDELSRSLFSFVLSVSNKARNNRLLTEGVWTDW